MQDGAGNQVLSAFVEILFDISDNRFPVSVYYLLSDNVSLFMLWLSGRSLMVNLWLLARLDAFGHVPREKRVVMIGYNYKVLVWFRAGAEKYSVFNELQKCLTNQAITSSNILPNLPHLNLKFSNRLLDFIYLHYIWKVSWSHPNHVYSGSFRL